MKEMVAYCGLVCTECLAYKATQKDEDETRARVAKEWNESFKTNFKLEDINCDGCLEDNKRIIGTCTMCEIRKCGKDKKVLNCIYCEEYPCDKLNKFHRRAPQAKAKLKVLSRNRRRNCLYVCANCVG